MIAPSEQDGNALHAPSRMSCNNFGVYTDMHITTCLYS